MNIECLCQNTTSFKLENEIVIIDPCYEILEWGKVVKDVLTGIYKPYVCYSDEGRVAGYILLNEDCTFDELKNKELLSDNLGVDSGQLGVFNLNYFVEKINDKKELDYNNISSFYRRVSEGTATDGYYITIDENGFCSSSGWGDGCYSAYAYRNNSGYIVAIEVIFINKGYKLWN